MNRSNRIKYRCDSCNMQVWGKPNLNILCGEIECHANPLLPADQTDEKLLDESAALLKKLELMDEA